MKNNRELLLVENVDNLGIVGDIVNVKPGYARNYLVPHGLAEPPSEGARIRVAQRRREVEQQLEQLAEQRRALIDRLEDLGEITLKRAANEQGALYGSVTQHDLAEELREAGYDVEDRFIRIGEQIKRLDSYEIPIVIDKHLQTQIKAWVVSDQPTHVQTGDEAEAGEIESAEDEVSSGYARQTQ